MKLFLKDHLSIILLYLITFICLPVLIDQLDGFKNHYWIYVNILDTFFESLFSKRIHSRECHRFRLISNGEPYLTLGGDDDEKASWISSSKNV